WLSGYGRQPVARSRRWGRAIWRDYGSCQHQPKRLTRGCLRPLRRGAARPYDGTVALKNARACPAFELGSRKEGTMETAPTSRLRTDDSVKVVLEGRITAYTAAPIWQTAIDTLARNPDRPVVVDASRLEYADDVGIALLFDLLRRDR